MAQQFEGKNLEEALTLAAQALSVDRYQLTYHVVQEKRGFLGAVKHVVIEAEVNQTAATGSAEAATTQRSSVGEPVSAQGGAPAGDRSRGDRPRSRGRRSGGGSSRSGGGSREPRQDEALQSGDFERFAAEVPPQGAESEHARDVRLWCEELIETAGLELVVRTSEDDEQIAVRLHGRDTVKLVDQHGELLDAIQVLANKALVGRKTEKPIEFDSDAFKERRTGALEQTAREVADRVRQDGREQLLPAMTPIERRIIHLALRDAGDVATESRGEGFYKRVAIVKRAPGSAAEPPSTSP